MNESDTMPNYRVDNSNETLTNTENKKKEAPSIDEYKNNGLSKTKIININDFIFRQYLEFYPELQGLSCKDNILCLKENGDILASEALTFDLRTLPGEAWNVNAKKFMEIIKLNKNCKKMEGFIDLLTENNTGNFMEESNKEEILEEKITNYMNLYFIAKDSFQYLTDDNKSLVGRAEIEIANTPKDSLKGKIVNRKLDEYFEITKEMGNPKGKVLKREMQDLKNLPVPVQEEVPIRSSKAAFVNIAIIIYGVLNIGIILAIALMK